MTWYLIASRYGINCCIWKWKDKIKIEKNPQSLKSHKQICFYSYLKSVFYFKHPSISIFCCSVSDKKPCAQQTCLAEKWKICCDSTLSELTSSCRDTLGYLLHKAKWWGMEKKVTAQTLPETLVDTNVGPFTAVPTTKTKVSIHPTAFNVNPKENVLGSQWGSRTECAKVCDPVLRSAPDGSDLLPSNTTSSLQPPCRHLSAPLCPHILFWRPGINGINKLCWATKPLKSVVHKSHLCYGSRQGTQHKNGVCAVPTAPYTHVSSSHNTVLLRPWKPAALYNKAHQVQ